MRQTVFVDGGFCSLSRVLRSRVLVIKVEREEMGQKWTIQHTGGGNVFFKKLRTTCLVLWSHDPHTVSSELALHSDFTLMSWSLFFLISNLFCINKV